MKTSLRSFFLRLSLLCLIASVAACNTGATLVRADTAELAAGLKASTTGDIAGLQASTTGAAAEGAAIGWFRPSNTADEASLSRWRRSVGPPVIRSLVLDDDSPVDRINVISWNTAVGEADVVRFAETLPPGPVVLLLQEVYRAGSDVPSLLPQPFAFAGHLGGANAGPNCRQIEDVAARLGLNIYYVPSMRNGGPTFDEDRGNAILSNMPLTDLEALELPFERQRRVAIAATIHGHTASGAPWHVRLVSAHLDNMGSAKRAWLGAEYGRARQARELTAVLRDSEPTILAGDFNTWFGFSDRAYLETARAFPQTIVTDRRATFLGLLRLDHVFYRLQPGWRAEFRRAESRFGSDHYPLVGALQFN